MIVGLTGGIGSGKTTVANMFAELGIPVFIADLEARKIMETDEELREQIISVFGEKAYTGDKPDRKYLAEIVFNNRKKLKSLNSLVHPAVRKYFMKWYAAQTAPYVIYESAILFESGGESRCDKIITVTAPREVRISRTIKRDRVKREEVIARMDNQLPENKKVSGSDFVIENLNLEEIKAAVDRINRYLIKKKT